MLKTLPSKINYLHSSINMPENLLLSLEDFESKNDRVFIIENDALAEKELTINKAKNIFLVYTDATFFLYKGISSLIKDACKMYNIDTTKQKYFIYGKVVQYSMETNNNWYDFPGINKPFLHGFYFIDGPAEIFFENNDKIESKSIKQNDIVINKPTDLIKIKTDNTINVVEFYISPTYMLKYNEPGVWCPILS
jgi:hypothetical protein